MVRQEHSQAHEHALQRMQESMAVGDVKEAAFWLGVLLGRIDTPHLLSERLH